MKISVIGLGRMGAAMAGVLLKTGHAVTVYNRSADKAQPLADAGASVAATVAMASQADIVLTMLSNDAALEAVTFGEDGLLHHLPKGALHISASTISVKLADRLTQAHAEAGHAFISAPVFGRPDAAAAGKLFIVAGGDAAAIASAAPVLDEVGQRTFVVSATPSAANLVKLSGNFLIASVIETLGEAMALVGKGGVDQRQYLDILTSTLFNAPVYKTYGGLIAEGTFRPAGFAAPLGLKDIRLTLEAAEALNTPLPVASLLRDRFLTLLAHGGSDLDWSAIGALAAKDAGADS